MADIVFNSGPLNSGFDNVNGFIANINWNNGNTTRVYPFPDLNSAINKYYETSIVHTGLTGALQDLNGIFFKRLIYVRDNSFSFSGDRSERVESIEISANGTLVQSVKNIAILYSEFNFYQGTPTFINVLYGGNDRIQGSRYGDALYTVGGSDTLFGNDGDDFLIVNFSLNPAHVSIVYGGLGEDRAVFGNSTSDYKDFVVSKSPSSGFTSIYYEDGRLLGRVAPDVEKLDLTNSEAIVNPARLLSLSDQQYWGQTTLEKSTFTDSVYRFFNTRDKAFFYTNSKDERNFILQKSNNTNPPSEEWPYVFQGTTFESAHTYPKSQPLFRFYNTQTGHHFFTASQDEANYVKAKVISDSWPFNYEGVAFNVYANDPTPNSQGSEIAVHRFYSPSLNRHFYTANQTEFDEIRLTGKWNYEGIGFWGEG